MIYVFFFKSSEIFYLYFIRNNGIDFINNAVKSFI